MKVNIDLERILRLIRASLQATDMQTKQNYLWEIAEEFRIFPEDISNTLPKKW
jgi:hypothetical protein